MCFLSTIFPNAPAHPPPPSPILFDQSLNGQGIQGYRSGIRKSSLQFALDQSYVLPGKVPIKPDNGFPNDDGEIFQQLFPEEAVPLSLIISPELQYLFF